MKYFLQIIKSARKYYKYIALGFIGLVLSTAVQLTAPRFLSGIIGAIAEGVPDLATQARNTAILLLLMYALLAVSEFIARYYVHHAAWKYVADLQSRVYDKLQGLSLGYYHDKQTGQLLSRTVSDTRNIEELVAHTIPDTVMSFSIFIGVSIILFTINTLLATFVFLTIPFFLLIIYRFGKTVYPMFRETHQKNAELTAVVTDNLSGMKEIQAFNQENRESEKVYKAAQTHIDAMLRALKKSATYHPFISFIGQLSTVLVIGVGGTLAAGGSVTITDIAAFMLYLGMFYSPLSQLARLNENLQNSLACAARIFEILDTPAEIIEKENAFELKNVRGDVEFRNINFSYVKEQDVLTDINLKIPAGKMVALVGQTGVGKTTLASLVPRFYDPVSGEVLIDGVDISDVTLSSLRQNISMVMQDVFLFNGTVAENIAYGDNGVPADGGKLDMEKIIRVAKSANAYDFIMEMPEKFNTVIGERGVKLSGGQKQRLSIARALLRDTPILILDEATASVDMATEKLIHEAIDSVTKNRTTLVIAHRLASIKKADLIVVIDEGVIKEMGTHNELMNIPGGIYAGLCNIQNEFYELQTA